jgi:hypothetical protein
MPSEDADRRPATLPAGVSAKGGQVAKLAAQECKQERQDIGRNEFRKATGPETDAEHQADRSAWGRRADGGR